MIIQIDSRQKMNKKHHKMKEKWFTDNGHTIKKSKCFVGDYICPSKGSISVDTKQNCSELYSNLIQDHKRFHNECVLAKECGIKLIILIENTDGFTKPEDIMNWKNPQMYRYWNALRKAQKYKTGKPKPPASNLQLLKIMNSMSRDYGVEFQFCRPEQAAERIVQLLGGDE